MYLEFAELQAMSRHAMTMKAWIEKLDNFLKLSGRDILSDGGKISHDSAVEKAHEEYAKYGQFELQEPTEVEKHFIEAEKELIQIEKKGKSY